MMIAVLIIPCALAAMIRRYSKNLPQFVGAWLRRVIGSLAASSAISKLIRALAHQGPESFVQRASAGWSRSRPIASIGAMSLTCKMFRRWFCLVLERRQKGSESVLRRVQV